MTDEKEITKEAKKTSEISGKAQEILAQVEKLTVLELNDLVKALEDKFGVAPVVGVAAANTPTAEGAEAAAEEKASYTIVLKAGGSNKIAVIKAVREINQELGLKEAKDLVDTAPKEIAADVNKEAAQEAKKKLEEAGAEVELK